MAMYIDHTHDIDTCMHSCFSTTVYYQLSSTGCVMTKNEKDTRVTTEDSTV